MTILIKLLYGCVSSFLWRVRGGLKFWGHKAPLNKIWFALWYATEYCLLTKWDLNIWAVTTIATLVSYQEYGWGEYVMCLLGGRKPDERSDCSLVDDIVDTLKITYKGKVYKLVDYPRLFGWLGLSLRGGIMSFTIGLAIQNIPYMFTGLAMGTVYWLGGLVCKYIKDDGKYGWRWAEWLYGFYLGLVLCVIY